MTVRILKPAAGAAWSALPGDVIDLDATTGPQLIEAGYAEFARETGTLERAALSDVGLERAALLAASGR